MAVVAGSVFAAPPAALAQTCAYNSTQATCACPTSGGGTTCFGGLLYRASDSTCQADSRPCSSSQVYDCGSLSCVCPSGTTLCSSSGSCVANRTCPAGSTWDVCTDTCQNPYVLISPGAAQNGYISVTGDIKSSGGDAYLSNGKAIRVDGSGTTTLNLGNWGSGATGFNVGLFGNFGIGTSTPTTKLDVLGNVRVNNNGTSTLTIRREAPATDFASLSFDTAGTTQWSFGLRNSGTNDLYLRDNINGLTLLSIMQGTGNLGVGTTTPAQKLDVAGTAKMTGLQLTTGAGANKVLMSDASGNGTWQTVGTSGATTGSGTTNYHSKWTASGTLGNSIVFDDGTNVGVGTAAPATKLDVNGTAKVVGFLMATGAGAGRVLTSDASGNGTWTALPSAPVTSVSGSGSGISVSPTTGAVVVSNTGVTSASAGTGIGLSGSTGPVTISNTGVTSLTAGSGISLSGSTGAITITNTVSGAITGSGTASYVPKFTSASSIGNSQIVDNGTTVGIGGAASGNKLMVLGDAYVQSGLGAGIGPTGNIGVRGYGSAEGVEGSGPNYGVFGSSTGGAGVGVYGTGPSWGGWFTGGTQGVYANGSSTGITANGTSYGGYFTSTGSNTTGVYVSSPGTGIDAHGYTGVNGVGTLYGAYGTGNIGLRADGQSYGLYAQATNAGGYGVSASGGGYGVYGTGSTYGLKGYSASTGVYAQGGNYGIQASGTSYGAYNTGGTYGTYSSGSSYGDYGTGQYGVFGSGSYAGVYGTGPYSFMGSGTLYNSGNATITGTIDSNYYQSEWNGHAWNGGSYGPYNTGVSTQTVMCFTHMVHIWGQGGKCDTWMSGGYWYFGVWSWASSSDVYCAFSCFKYK